MAPWCNVQELLLCNYKLSAGLIWEVQSWHYNNRVGEFYLRDNVPGSGVHMAVNECGRWLTPSKPSRALLAGQKQRSLAGPGVAGRSCWPPGLARDSLQCGTCHLGLCAEWAVVHCMGCTESHPDRSGFVSPNSGHVPVQRPHEAVCLGSLYS